MELDGYLIYFLFQKTKKAKQICGSYQFLSSFFLLVPLCRHDFAAVYHTLHL